MKGRTFQPILFNPFCRRCKDVWTVMVETKNEAAIHLDAMIVEHSNTPGVIGRAGRPFFGVAEILSGERLKSDEHAGAAAERHLADEIHIVGDIERHRSAPDAFERSERAAKGAKIIRSRTEIVVDENGVRL